jgi:GT2 family glycosyltransferase
MDLLNTKPISVSEKEMLPFVSVVIPTAGKRLPELLKCIKSIKSLNYPFYEVIVVSDKPLDQFIRSYVKDLDIKFYTGGGVSNNRNKGIQIARGTFVALTDDDCVVDKNWLKCLVKTLLKEPDAGAVSGRILPLWERNPPCYLRKLIPTIQFAFAFEERTTSKELHTLFGSNVVFRKKALCEVGLFDPSFGPNNAEGRKLWYGENVDLAHRLMRRGYKIIYNPEAIVKHKIGTSRMKLTYILKRVWLEGRVRSILNQKYPEYRVGMQTSTLHLSKSTCVRLIIFLLTGNLRHLVEALLRLGFLMEKLKTLPSKRLG